VTQISIEGGGFTINATDGASIGTAFGRAIGVSSIGSITITDGNFELRSDAAGIGTGTADNNPQSIGSITINGGVFGIIGGVTGIGAAAAVRSSATVDSVSINGGRFVIRGSRTAIGSGLAGAGGVSSVGAVTINDGVFDIDLLGESTGIGAGGARTDDAPANSSVGSIAINGGSFTIATEEAGAGIGAGLADASTPATAFSSVGGIRISGGNFRITVGLDGSGIGAGYSVSSSSTVGSTEISDGTFDITVGMRGAGIGAGSTTGGTASVDSVRVLGGNFSITVGLLGAAIGAGYSSRGSASVQLLEVRGGFLKVTGGIGAAGIGGGHTDTGSASVSQLLVRSRRLEATGGDGAAAIGCGTTSIGNAGITTMTVLDGNLILHGESGLHSAGQLVVFGGDSTGSLDLDCDVVDGPCLSAPLIDLGAGALTGSTNGFTFFKVGLVITYASESGTALFSITGKYTRDSHNESLGLLPRIRFPNLPSCGGSSCAVEVKAASGTFSRSLSYGDDVVGAIISVPTPGAYDVKVTFPGSRAPIQRSYTVGSDESEATFEDAPKRSITGIVLGAIFGVLGGVIVVLSVFCIIRWRRNRLGLQSLPGHESADDVGSENRPPPFWDV
jgi:hypothetical protein